MLLGSYTKTCNLYLNWKNQHELKIFDSLKKNLVRYTERPRKNDNTGGMSTSRIQMVVHTILHQKKPWVLKEMARSKYTAGKVPDKPGEPCARKQRYAKH